MSRTHRDPRAAHWTKPWRTRRGPLKSSEKKIYRRIDRAQERQAVREGRELPKLNRKYWWGWYPWF